MDLPRIWKTLVCIAASISMVLCTVSMQVAASPAGDGRGPVTMVDQGPPIPTDPDAEPDAPYSPGEMMELGITDVTALEPMVLATYPSYTSSQIAKDDGGMWYVIATRAYLNKWVIVDGNYRYYDGGILQTGWKQLPASNEAGAAVYWFYLGTDGNMRTGWIHVESNNGYLYLKPSTGIMAQSEWVQINSYWYYFDSDGYMERSWLKIGDNWYYLREATGPDYTNGPSRPDGSMVTGEQYIPKAEGSTEYRSYYFDKSGVMRLWTYPLPTTEVSGIDSSDYTPYYVTSRFAEWRTLYDSNGNPYQNQHNGLDLKARVPVEIRSATSGKVVTSALTTSMGNLVVVESDVTAPNGNLLYVRYMHLSQRSVVKNDLVSPGTLLGKTGNTGNVAYHAHIDVNAFEITTGAVSAAQGQNPAAFYQGINWVNKQPHGEAYRGYLE